MKTFILIVFLDFFLLTYLGNSVLGNPISKSKIDSLTEKLKIADGLEKSKILNELSAEYWGISTAKSLEYAKEALNLAKEINDDKAIASALNNIGNTFWIKSVYDSALVYYDKSYKIRKMIGDEKGIAGSLHNKAMVYTELGENDKSLKTYFASLEHYKIAKDSSGISKVYNSIGTVYLTIKNYKQALEYLQKSLEEKERLKDSLGVVAALNNIGIAYWRENKLKLAEKVFQRSLNLKVKLGSYYSLGTLYSNLGSLAMEQKKFKKALKYFAQSYTNAQVIDDTSGMLQTRVSIAQIHIHLKNFNKAKKILDEILPKTKEKEISWVEKSCYIGYINLYEAEKNYKTALKYYDLLDSLKDELYSSESSNKIAELQVSYEAKEKENEIALLKKEKKIQTLQLIKEKNFRDFLIISSILFILFGLSIYYAYKLKSKTNEKLKLLNSTKDKFFSIISHDLKNPFNSIKAFSEMLIKDFDKLNDDEKKISLQQISKSAGYSSELLDNLLSWSMAQRNMMPISPRKINLKNLVEKSVDLLKFSADNKGINIFVNVNPDIWVMVDSNTISTVLRNLISNAIKFTNEKGEIKINANKIDDKVEVEIMDNGIGIKKEDLDKLFRIDIKSSTIGESEEKGTGLGLILAKEFVLKNGGDIWAESTFGKGSIFKFIIPSA